MTENHSTGSHAAARKEPEAATILLVDDDPINLNVLFQALEGRDYRLLAARSGEEALKIAQRVAPILILLDVKMPGIDGYETCRRLKADLMTKDAAIIFLTALQDTQEKVKGLSLGAVDFITKPFDNEEILARVARQVEMQHLSRKLREENRQLADQIQNLHEKNSARGTVSVAELIRQGENDRVEFKSTMRWNLKTDKADKAVEKAWLKTIVAFLNTDGGNLLRLTRTPVPKHTLAFSPDGRFLSYLQEGDLWLWNQTTGQLIQATRRAKPAVGNEQPGAGGNRRTEGG